VTVEGRTSIPPPVRAGSPAPLDADDELVLLAIPRTGEPVRLYVSARTYLVMRKDSGAESTTYTDFKNVDGEVVPFAWTVHDALGDKAMKVKEVRFKVPIADGTFAKLPALKR
jgi:hypothetical protein